MNRKTFFLAFMIIAVALFGLVSQPGIAQAAPAEAATCSAYHTVQRGEYLSQIARKYGVSWRWLAEINNLANPSRIYPGQKLCVETAPVTVTCTAYHTVQRGEYLSLIARQYGVSWRWLAEINNLANPSRIYTGQKICVKTGSGTGGEGDGGSGGPYTGFPTLSITSVVEDTSVTIRAGNLPAGDSFDVLMGRMGTRAVNGIKVGTIAATGGGSATGTFNIPQEMRDRKQVAIRIQSNTGSGFYAYDWFYNQNSGSGTGGEGNNGGYSGIPTFSIASVVRNDTVTIRTNNFPANVQFDVRMGRIGTRAVNGIKVATINSGQGGAFTATFDIPAELQGHGQIAIRMESADTGYFAYNWFWNNTAP